MNNSTVWSVRREIWKLANQTDSPKFKVFPLEGRSDRRKKTWKYKFYKIDKKGENQHSTAIVKLDGVSPVDNRSFDD